MKYFREALRWLWLPALFLALPAATKAGIDPLTFWLPNSEG